MSASNQGNSPGDSGTGADRASGGTASANIDVGSHSPNPTVSKLTARPGIKQYMIHHRWPWLAASLLLTCLLLLAASVGWLWYRDQVQRAAHQLSLDLTWLEQGINGSLAIGRSRLLNWAGDLPASGPDAQPGSLARPEARFHTNPHTNPQTQAALAVFLQRTQGLMQENPAILSIDYLNAHGQRLAGWPDYGPNNADRPKQLPPLNDPAITLAAQRSQASGQPAYSEVIEQYGALWVLVVPVAYDNGSFGSILATYDLNQFVEKNVPWRMVQRYDLGIFDRNGKPLSPMDSNRDSNAPERDVHELTFGQQQSSWSLRISARQPGHAPILLAALALVVVLLALLLMFFLRLLQRWLRERQAVQQALAQELRFRAAMEHSLITGLLAFDSSGKIIYTNPAFCRLLGLSEPQLLGSSAPFAFWPPAGSEHHASAQQAHQAMLRGDNPASGHNLMFLHADGRLLSVRLFASPLVDAGNQPNGWMASLYDLTAERQAANIARERDELLQHTSRLASLAEFASGIAHELNQPLAAIANYSAAADCFLDMEPRPIEKVQQAVRRMGEESRRAGQIVHSLRSFIQKRAVRHEVHDLSTLLAEPLALLQGQMQRSQVKILLQNDAGAIWLECDAVMIEQVIFNLLRNAIEAVAALAQAGCSRDQVGSSGPDQLEHASRCAEPVRLHLLREQDSVLVRVSDRGAGIVDHEKLFQAFYTTKPEGMGLGLAICRTVIESHGGRLWAEDDPQGGAIFTFRLPCLTQQAGAQSCPSPHPPKLQADSP